MIKSKLGFKSATSRWLSSTLLRKIVALQLVTFLAHVFFKTKRGVFLINRDHVLGYSNISLIPQMVVSCFPGEGLAYLCF
jgi:hypothetical protein